MTLNQQWAATALASGKCVAVTVPDGPPDTHDDYRRLSEERLRRGDDLPLIAVEPCGFARCCLLPNT